MDFKNIVPLQTNTAVLLCFNFSPFFSPYFFGDLTDLFFPLE